MITFVKGICLSFDNCSSKKENIKKITLLSINLIFFIGVTVNVGIFYFTNKSNDSSTTYSAYDFISDLFESFLWFSLLFEFKPKDMFSLKCKKTTKSKKNVLQEVERVNIIEEDDDKNV